MQPVAPVPVNPKWLATLITFEVPADAKKITAATVAVFAAMGALLCFVGLPTAGIILGVSGLLVIPFRAHQIDRIIQGKLESAVKYLAKGKEMATFPKVTWNVEGAHEKKLLIHAPQGGMPNCFVGRANNRDIFAGFTNQERVVVIPLDRSYLPFKWILESQGTWFGLQKKVLITKDIVTV